MNARNRILIDSLIDGVCEVCEICEVHEVHEVHAMHVVIFILRPG